MNKDLFVKAIESSAKRRPCDLVIKNVNVIDVFQCSTFISDVGISNGYIVGLGEYSGTTEIDGTGKYICPSLIDSHAHIESSLLTPKEYYKCALRHGITSMVIDPHEIANVFGKKGIDFMINSSKDIPFDFYFMLSSCVPATSFESSGAILNSSDLKPYYENRNILGLAEVMNYPAVLNCEEDMIQKLWDAKENNGVIDGHCAGFNNDMVNVYATANIRTDHESVTYNELIEKVRRGMYVLIREGTVAKNLKDLVHGASIFNSRRLCLCTDDKHIDDLVMNGSIDNSIKLCVNNGLKSEIAIQMATLNPSECYNLRNKGAIAPGYVADFLILDSLEDFSIESVYKNGTLVVKNNELFNMPDEIAEEVNLPTAMNIKELTPEDLKIDISNKDYINVIELIPNKLESNHLKIKIDDLKIKDVFTPIIGSDDLLKVSVMERHNNTGNIGLGILKGLKLNSGAIATTITHDSHNLIVAGTNDSDMIFAVEELKKLGGGIIVVQNGQVLSSIKLEIGGVITGRKAEEVIQDLAKLHDAIDIISPEIDFNPFLTLSFLALPVIPSLKITDKGIFDVEKFEFIPVSE